MRVRRLCLIPLALAFSVSAAGAPKRCELKSFAELPVIMEGLRPLVIAKINGADARFLADSGAFYSMLSPAAAAQFKLPIRPAPLGFFVEGVGGTSTPELATVGTFTLANYPIRKVEFLVGGNDLGVGVVGLLGRNLMANADVEYDLANGMLRYFRAENCGNSPLVYWTTSEPFGVVELHSSTGVLPQAIGTAFVNGAEVRVGFDTGAAVSMLSLTAAKRAGISPGNAGLKPAGTTHGIGRGVVNTWVAPLSSFKIGGEEIRNTQVLIADMQLRDVDMLLGDDFFLSHRVYVAYSQRKAYFTYNGGPVFSLEGPKPAQHTPAEPANAPGSTSPAVTSSPAPAANSDGSSANQPPASSAAPSATNSVGQFADQPTDAAGFMRRGTAFAARKDYAHALADLTHACELAPREPEFLYELGRVRWQSGRPDRALQDFDKTLELKPDYLPALLARAELRLPRHAGVKEDLEAVDRLAAREANVRLVLGNLYEQIDEFAAAVHQYDVWIGAHGQDAQLPAALNARCWAQAEANQNLDRALKDCDAALHMRPRSAATLDSRALVQLRRGELDRAIADYDAALALAPRLPASLYGRGLAKLRKGLQAAGESDLAAARTIQPDISARFASFGLKP